jgi:hypothetical protein
MDWVLQRAKAFIAAVAVGVVPVIISAAEKASGFDIPATWEAWLLLMVTGLTVYATPNKPA